MGAGAVGGYFGARLAAASNDVAFIARGLHLAAMQQEGLTLEAPGQHTFVTLTSPTIPLKSALSISFCSALNPTTRKKPPQN
jgi:ketopantoate reductase